MDEDATVLGSGGSSWEELEPGTQLDNYRIVRMIGRGGMGAVYLAEHTSLQKQYAIKVLPEELSGDSRFRERFREEGRRMASLEHPGILPIYYAGEWEGRHYFAMEYLSGGDLEGRMKAQTENGTIEPLPVEEVRAILVQLLEALSYAHEKGVIHRDLKPANLLLTKTGKVKIADFGLAQMMGEGYMRDLVQKTLTASTMNQVERLTESSIPSSYAGTIHYMAPEVVSNGEASERSDLYAIGVMAYFLLTGKKPIGKYREVSRLNPAISRDWDDWLDGLLEPEPEERIPSAEKALETLPSLETEVGAATVSGGAAKGGGMKWVLGSLILVALIGVGLYFGLNGPGGTSDPVLDPPVTPPEEMEPPSLESLEGPYGSLVVKGISGASVFAVSEAGDRFLLGSVGEDLLFESRDQLPEGEWTIEAEKEGFATGRAEGVELSADQMRVVEIPMESIPASLIVGTTPVGADVFLNGEPVGTTPAVLEAVPSEEPIELEVRLSGFRKVVERISLTGGENRRLRYSLEAASGDLRLILQNPELSWAGVQLEVDGEPKGLRSETVRAADREAVFEVNNLGIGERTLTIRAPDFSLWEKSVEVLDSRTVEVPVELVPLPGVLRVTSDPGGAEVEVLLDGERVGGGTAPLELESVPSGVALQIIGSLDGFRPEEEERVIEPGGEDSVRLGPFARAGGDLLISVRNPGLDLAEVTVEIDGKTVQPEVGKGNLELEELEFGRRTVSLRHPNYLPYQDRVQISSQRTGQMEVRLEPKPANLEISVIGPRDFHWELRVDGEALKPDRDGRIRLPAEKEVQLEVQSLGWKPFSQTFSLTGGESRRIEVEMERDDGPKPGSDATVALSGEVALDLIWIDSGSFMMGSPYDEPGRRRDEGPQTWVRLSSGYWIGETEVTIAQYRTFAKQSGFKTEAEREPREGMKIFNGTRWEEGPRRSWRNRFADSEEHPVIGVSWNDAVAFCEWLTERERRAGRLPDGYAYQLPTEAQWENAARAGSTSLWSFGGDEANLGRYAWHRGNSDQRTHAVARKSPNPLGLYDVHGNAWEWTADWMGDYPGTTVRDFDGPSMGSNKVIRGGSWYDSARFTRVAFRHQGSPGIRYDNLGFRICLAPDRR